MIERNLEDFFKNKKILILGFGKEGESTFRFLRKLMPELHLGIADRRSSTIDDFKNKFGSDEKVSFFVDERYLESLQEYDLVIKSPGISYKVLPKATKLPVITSQTELFIKLFRDRIVGVTGSKGKSTTSSLIYHILQQAKQDVVFVGNIGVPPFERVEKINPGSWIVYELSSHQLEHIKVSPHISVLLNVFQEHLDHYNSYVDYQNAKFNIARFQHPDDYCIFNAGNKLILELVEKNKLSSKLYAFGEKPYGEKYCFLSGSNFVFYDGETLKNIDSKLKLTGRHNLYNTMSAVIACRITGVDAKTIIDGISSFTGLPHRLEYIGRYGGVDYYNDSIATIPEAAIEAINSVPTLATVILGGHDRGVEYSELANCLISSELENVILTGKAGSRILNIIKTLSVKSQVSIYFVESFDEAVKKSIKLTPTGKACLLAPAAASYDAFRNFEERGERFREIVKGNE